MAVLRLFLVECFGSMLAPIPGNHLLSGPKPGLDRRMRLHRFCANLYQCLLKGGQEGFDILVDEFPSLLGFWESSLAAGEAGIQGPGQAFDIRWRPGGGLLPEPAVA